MGNDFYNPTGYENEGLPSGRNLEGQIALWHPVLTSALQMRYVILFQLKGLKSYQLKQKWKVGFTMETTHLKFDG